MFVVLLVTIFGGLLTSSIVSICSHRWFPQLSPRERRAITVAVVGVLALPLVGVMVWSHLWSDGVVLSVRTVDTASMPIQDASVLLVYSDGGTDRAVTDSNGLGILRHPQSGKIAINKPGFDPKEITVSDESRSEKVVLTPVNADHRKLLVRVIASDGSSASGAAVNLSFGAGVNLDSVTDAFGFAVFQLDFDGPTIDGRLVIFWQGAEIVRTTTLQKDVGLLDISLQSEELAGPTITSSTSTTTEVQETVDERIATTDLPPRGATVTEALIAETSPLELETTVPPIEETTVPLAVETTALPAEPGVPRNLTGNSDLTQVALGWAAPVSDGGAPVSSYQVEREGSGVKVSNSTGLIWTGLSASTQSRFRVQACNNVGCGSFTSWKAFSTDDPSTPTAPQGVSVTPGRGQVGIGWTAPSSNGGAPVTSYQVQRQGSTTQTTTGLSLTWSGLSDSTTYRFSVRACNSAGCGPASALVSATTTAAPSPVVSASWGAGASGRSGCGSAVCYLINYSWANFAANQTVTVQCGNITGVWGSYVINTGSGSGSGSTAGQCWTDDDFQTPIWIAIDGVRSKNLPNND